MIKDKKRRETVALVRNKLYRTYQFHGIVGKGKNPEIVFNTVISQIFLWLRDRFRQFEDIPEQILQLSDISQINEASLQPFHINDGYIIETTYQADDKIWSFRLTEPDMGTSDRLPVPGRLFITNFALKIIDGCVELGCKTLCSQPESIEEDAEVFRPKLVRDIKDSIGLWDIIELTYEAGNLVETSWQRKLKAVLDSGVRNMPVVIIKRKKQIFISNEISLKRDYLGSALKSSIDIKAIIKKESLEAQIDWAKAADEITKSLCGFAYIFCDISADSDQVDIIYPSGEEEVINTDQITGFEQEYLFRRGLIDKIRSYPKRNERFNYGSIVFLQDVIAIKQERDLDRLNHSENCLDELKELYRINERLRKEKVREEQKNRDCFEKYNQEKNARKAEEISFCDKLRQMSEKYESLGKEKQILAEKLSAAEKEIEVYQSKENRPDKIEDLIKWIEQYYKEDIILLSRAENEIRKAKNCSIELMCDGIEVLAQGYRKRKLGLLNEEQYNLCCKSLCKTPFEITQTGDASIRKYPKDYKVPYHDEIAIARGGKRKLDMHLKYGVDPKFLLRIYFFWDDQLKKVVIGSMPEHLRSVE